MEKHFKIIKTKNWYLDKINKISKTISGLMKKQQKRRVTTNLARLNMFIPQKSKRRCQLKHDLRGSLFLQ